MTDVIKEQILAIRDSGLTNMFDLRMVQAIARELDYPELADFIDQDAGTYPHFILTGEVK